MYKLINTQNLDFKYTVIFLFGGVKIIFGQHLPSEILLLESTKKYFLYG